ncbi:DNA internalization-related competence protein ComEC/Rec2 [Sporolactobacillus shoreicorticis]|uniref:DNA internalization-related competence protein ComEC/Rec2 n=1 Tax=Sporolactobacillus shoreicorticis TaxID=1923877 RepID=A0ABW5S6E5_9BACL|nr:DNA internalization-related competence protein ComEC/Rec2 [Sporolactobacillus shoreicorticis]MCO7126354.1 DNA internalization-related competence protein ComEC/Rec2 [Sporolactobacillus shoreicorticis]
MPFSGKWHLFAMSGCLAAWTCLSTNPIIPAALFAVYGIYLIILRKYQFFGTLLLILLIIKIDLVFFQKNDTVLSDRQQVVQGRITDLPIFDGDRLHFKLKTDQGESIMIDVKLQTEQQKRLLLRELKIGMRCRVKGKLERPEPPSNFHAFNQRLYLERHHIYWRMKAAQIPNYSDADLSLLDWLRRVRQNQITFISTHFTSTAAEMMNALLLGSDDQMDPELANAYRIFGLVHLLVVSGMHVAVVFGVLFYLLRRAGMVREYASLLLLVLLPVYVVITGAEPSIVRSGITAGCVLIFTLMKKRRLTVSDLIALACLLMVFYDPRVVYDLGFQLSFTVTFVVLIAGPTVLHSYQSPLLRMIILSLICELVTFPIIVPNFYQLSLVGILLSVFFVPFITFVILPLCFVAYFFALFFTGCSVFFSYTVDTLLFAPHQFLLYLSRWMPMQLTYGALSGWQIGLSVVLIFTSLIIWECFHSLKFIFALLAPFFLIFGVIWTTDQLDTRGSVTFLDVGQGDSILIRLPHNAGNMLIDTGGTIEFGQEKWRERNRPFEVGRDVVLRELLALRATHLDALVLTHRDADHVEGLKGIAGKIVVHQLLISPYHDPSAKDRALFELMIRDGTTINELHSGMIMKIGEIAFHALSPSRRSEESNDNSIVLYVTLGGKKWMFTGDLSQSGEKGLLERYSRLDTDVLKLGHHGSRTSTSEEWLTRLNPAIGIISSGRGNRYGHPHQEVIEKLTEHKVRILRTDQLRAIRFWFDQQQIINWEHASSP